MEYEIKYKKFDKKRSVDGQLNDLISELKQIGVKILENSKLNNGYGEGVCLILTQLLDKYLIIRNYIFKKPKLAEKESVVIEEIQNEFREVILEDNLNINTFNQKTKNNTTQTVCYPDNTNFNLKNNLTLKDIVKMRFSSGRKRWSSAMSNLTQGKNNTITI
jgi:hypothetical protein